MSHDLSAVRRDDDRDVLAQLVAEGDPLTSIRPIIVFFSSDASSRSILVALAQHATARSWRVVDLIDDGLALETDGPVDPDSVNALSDQMEAWATEFGIEFTGWECEVAGV